MERIGKAGGKRKQSRGPRKATRRAGGAHPHVHPFEVRRKAVQLCLEEGFPVDQGARELGVGFSTLGAWVRRYRAQGEAGLQAKPTGRGTGAAGARARSGPRPCAGWPQ